MNHVDLCSTHVVSALYLVILIPTRAGILVITPVITIIPFEDALGDVVVVE